MFPGVRPGSGFPEGLLVLRSARQLPFSFPLLLFHRRCPLLVMQRMNQVGSYCYRMITSCIFDPNIHSYTCCVLLSMLIREKQRISCRSSARQRTHCPRICPSQPRNFLSFFAICPFRHESSEEFLGSVVHSSTPVHWVIFVCVCYSFHVCSSLLTDFLRLLFSVGFRLRVIMHLGIVGAFTFASFFTLSHTKILPS